MTQASVHNIKVVDELLEELQQNLILANLCYLSQELKENLEQKGYYLWMPLCQNMSGAPAEQLEINDNEIDN